jgi:cobalt-zinc-cadmium efflux system membrane fusion protein
MSNIWDGIKNFVKASFHAMQSFFVFAALGVIAWFGHTFHWDVGHAIAHYSHKGSHTEKKSPETATTAESVTDSAPLRVDGDLPPVEFSSKEAARNCGIGTDAVVERAFDDQLSVNAEIGYDETVHAQIASRVSGTVWQVRHRLGDAVKAGEVLAIIDSAEVGDAKLELLQDCVVYHLKAQHRDRLKQLANTLAGKELMEAEAAYQLAKSTRFNALQKLINLGFSINLADVDQLSEQELASKLQFLGIPEADRIEGASYNLIPLIAPFDATITRCDLVHGEAVQMHSAIYELADTGSMWVYLHVRQDDAAKLKHGMRVEFEPSDGRNVVEGTIRWIGSNLDKRTRTIKARIDVANPFAQEGGSLRVLQAGMYGTARISLNQRSGLAVPADAMRWVWEIGQEVVFVANEDEQHFEPVVVKKGITRQGWVEVTGQVHAGQRVVSQGSRVLAAELSNYLEGRLGDNASAVRRFGHANNIHDDAPKPADQQAD